MLTPTSDYQKVRRTIAEAEADYFALLKYSSKFPRRKRRRSREKKNQDTERLEQSRLPFGGSKEWANLKTLMQPGDEFWEFTTSKSSWDDGLGVGGYMLMRGDTVIWEMITHRN